MGPYTLPDLPYDYGALEPHCKARIGQLHHDAHHQSYGDASNEALEQLAEARSSDDFSRIVGLEKALAFNVSGHLLHSVFWQNLSPDGGGEPQGDLAAAIAESFGSFAAFKGQLSAATSKVQGSGWGALVWEPLLGKLVVAQIYDHQANLTPFSLPLLVIDAWEHAYYLQYENRRPDWVAAVWNIIAWDDVASRLAEAREASAGIARSFAAT
jgi:superoxide dismutase, Fe-Mn family